MTTLKLAGAIALALIVAATAATEADAEPGDPRYYASTQRHRTVVRHARSRAVRPVVIVRAAETGLAALIRKQTEQIAQMRNELASFRRDFNPHPPVAAAPYTLAKAPNAVVLASLIDLPKELAPGSRSLTPVMPATATQRGQFNDRRRTHRHAGIDLGGLHGSEIVASYAGVVLSARWPHCPVKVCGHKAGGDTGYGPNVVVIQGDDGIVYRYAHLASMTVKVGQRVAAGERIGTMGKVGARGWPHLHFEMMRVAEYRRRPYGVHSLDPNDYLGGGRGKRMVAGAPMEGQSARAYAAAR